MSVKRLLIIFLIVLAPLMGCTQAEIKDAITIGRPGIVKLYSGGQLVEQWESTGKIISEENSDGWKFVDKKTKKLIRVSGTVVIIN